MDKPTPAPRGLPPPPPTTKPTLPQKKKSSTANNVTDTKLDKLKTAFIELGVDIQYLTNEYLTGEFNFIKGQNGPVSYTGYGTIAYNRDDKTFTAVKNGEDAANTGSEEVEEDEDEFEGEYQVNTTKNQPAYEEGEDQGKTIDNREGSTVALAGKAQKVKGAKTPSERIKSIIGGLNASSKYKAAKDTAIKLLKKTFNELNANDLEVDWKKIQSYLLTSAADGNPEKFDIKHGEVSLTLNVELSKGKILILQEIKTKKEIQQLDQASIKHIPQFVCKKITKEQMYILLCDPRTLGKNNGYRFDKGYRGHEEWKRTLKDKKYAGYLSFWDNNMDLVNRVMSLPITLRDTFLLELLRLVRKVNDGNRTLLYYLFVYDNEFLRILCEDIIKYLELDGIKRKQFGTSATKYIYYYPGKVTNLDRANPIEKYLYFTVTVDTKLFVKLTEVGDKEEFEAERYINPQRVTVKRTNGGISKVGISVAKTKLQRLKQYLPWGKTKKNQQNTS